jgi:hypothetical protein
MRIVHQLFLAVTLAVPAVLRAQASDSIHIGDRVRVRIAATHGNTGVFIGNIASILPDTLVLDIPGGKGTITLARAAISEVAVAEGRESHFANLPRILPALIAPVLIASTPVRDGPHANGFRNRRYLLVALSALPLIVHFRRTPPERWQPVYSWLDARPAR